MRHGSKGKRRNGPAHSLATIINAPGGADEISTVPSSQAAQVCHLAVAVEKRMDLFWFPFWVPKGKRRSRHLPEVIDGRAGGEPSAQRAQIRNRIQNIGGCLGTTYERQSDDHTARCAHLLCLSSRQSLC